MTIVYCLAAVNVLGFGIMGWDKWRAMSGGWRVPEKTLFAVALVGGSLGVFLGMRWFRHKTKHALFTIGIPLILIIQAFLLYRQGWW